MVKPAWDPVLGYGSINEDNGVFTPMTLPGGEVVWDAILGTGKQGGCNLTLDGVEHDVEVSTLLPAGSFAGSNYFDAAGVQHLGSSPRGIGNSTPIPPTMPYPGRIRRLLSAHINFHPGGSYAGSNLSAWLYLKQVVPTTGFGDGLWGCISNPPAALPWNSGTAYVAGNAVLSGGHYYTCIAGNTNQQPPNATYWSGNTNFNAGIIPGMKSDNSAFNLLPAETAPGSGQYTTPPYAGNRIQTTRIEWCWGMEWHVQYIANTDSTTPDTMDVRLHALEYSI
jgi:hypothetical protein